jgi:hypothetical protein
MKVDWLMPQDTPQSLISNYRIELAVDPLERSYLTDTDKEALTWRVVDGCGDDLRTTCNLDM